MKKVVSFLFILVSILSVDIASAQDFTLGVRGGISIPNLSANSSEKIL